MSYIGDALTFITGFLASPFVVSPSTGASGASAEHQRQPAEEGTSYFPKTASSSRRSSISSTSTDSSSVAPQPPALTRSHTGTNPLPPLARDFPPPKDELCIDTQLSLAPPKRSLHDSLRRAATEERRRPRADDAETKAQKLAAAKQEMLALAARR
ncbi:hypothetical protein PG989_010054 [Apiospora arundinis]|uniref:Uncharacterized protein n=1 Tax=Apiospora arundinis TaxID=335852 RepID=A0ABR2JBC8_9PEZI